jgi:DNA polymerase elongation subunit (family B)
MRTYIYNWEVLDPSARFKVHAYGLKEDGTSVTLTITGYYPYCYFDELEEKDVGYISGRTGIYPVSYSKKYMTSTLDITSNKVYTKLEFTTYTDMKKFSNYRRSYMDDVDPITGFLSANSFMFTGWYEVTGRKKVTVNQIKYLPDDMGITYPKIGCIDIETMSSTGTGMPKPYKRGDTIEMISMVFKRYLEEGKYTKYLLYVGTEELGHGYTPCRDELDLIDKMADIILKESPNVITGYNIFGFDLGYIISRLKLRLLPLPNMAVGKGVTRTYKVNWTSSAYGQNTYDRVEISGRVFVDLMLFFRRMKLDRYSLDFVSRKYLGEGKKDMSPETMWKYFRNRDVDGLRKVAEYCIHDSMLTLMLFDKFYIWTDTCEMSNVMKCNIEDIYTRGEQLKVLNQIIYKCVERNLVLTRRVTPPSKVDYQGAYVLDPKKGIYEGCTVMDFQSLYPSIIIAYNICPSTYLPGSCYSKHRVNTIGKHTFRKSPIGILPDLVKHLLASRVSVKDQIKGTDDPLTRMVLDRRQNALKICANSVYGITGFTGNKYMGHIPTAESITSTGRELLNSVVDTIGKKFPVEVVYGDTDSCMIHHMGTGREMAEEIVTYINKTLPPPLKLLVEKYYDKMAFLTKKRYLMYDGNVVTYKGVAGARRNYCNFTREIYMDTVRKIFESDPEEVLEFVVKSIHRLLKGRVPVKDLVMTTAVKEIDNYKNPNTPHVFLAKRLLTDGIECEGTRMEYLFVSVPKPKLQGERMFTPEEVRELDLPVDYPYYVEKQLVTAIDELLDLIGYGGCVKNITIGYRQ